MVGSINRTSLPRLSSGRWLEKGRKGDVAVDCSIDHAVWIRGRFEVLVQDKPIQRTEVALLGSIDLAIAAEGAPATVGGATAIGVVSIGAEAAIRSGNRAVATVALLETRDHTIAADRVALAEIDTG